MRSIKKDHDQSFDTGQLLFAEKEQEGQDTDKEEDHQVLKGGIVDADRMDRSGYAQNEQKIKNVRTDNISDGQLGLVLSGCHDRSDQFRKRGAESHDSQSDECLRHTCIPGDGLRTMHDCLTAANDQCQTDQDHQKALSEFGLFGIFFLSRMLLGIENEKGNVDDKEHQKGDAEDPAEGRRFHGGIDIQEITGREQFPAAAEEKDQNCRAKTYRKVALDDIITGGDGTDDGTDTQYHQKIKYIGTDDIT